jgi:hypothetical protein
MPPDRGLRLSVPTGYVPGVGVDVPDLRILAYHERKPMLRVVRVAAASFEAAPVSLDTGYALDDCLRLDGWFAFQPNQNVWGVPLPLGEDPFLIAKDTQIVCAARHRRSVWLQGRSQHAVTEYDGVARQFRRQIDLPGADDEWPWYLRAELADGFLVGWKHDLFHWSPPGEPRVLLEGGFASGPVDTTGTRLAYRSGSDDGFSLLDLKSGDRIPVATPADAQRGRTAFSPDGRWLAVDLDYSRPKTVEESMATIRAIASGQRVKYEPEPHRLGIVRCSDGEVIVTEGVYDNFPNLVWSRDSSWILLSAPFAPRKLWFARPGDTTLNSITFAKHVPSLLCDVSDLIA